VTTTTRIAALTTYVADQLQRRARCT